MEESVSYTRVLGANLILDKEELRMKKVGIVTFHRSYNYGSVLQAYALQKYLMNNGFDVKTIDYVMEWDFEQYRIFRTRQYKKCPKSFLADIVYLIPNLRRKRNFQNFVSNNLRVTENRYTDDTKISELNDEFDAFICGSDQIWNIDCTNGVDPVYFLKFVNDNKIKISYAPSLAHTSFELDTKEELSNCLASFQAVSVREESTLPFVKSISDKNIEVTLDPTLLLNKEDYIGIMSQTKEKAPYIFVYMLERNEQLLHYANEISQRYDLPIVYISKKQERVLRNAKNRYGISPNMFLEYINEAAYVVTNSFHATVFSVVFEKKFCTFKTNKSASRMVDLLTKLHLEDRIYSEQFEMLQEIEFKKVKNNLEKLRANSKMFLERELNKE